MKIAIIGGSGKMGRWFAKLLLADGQDVIITGRNRQKLEETGCELGVKVATNIEAAKNADAILLSVPIDNFEAVVREISPYTRTGQIIVDDTSVKVFPVELMHKYLKSSLVLGMHPVFGPGANDARNQNFVLTPAGKEETALAQKVKTYLETRGARVSLMTPHEHDQMMAVVLGLAHFIAIVSADTLLSFDKMHGMKAVSGTTYKVLLTLVESVLSEDPELYASLQMRLPDLSQVEELFQAKVKVWVDLVKNQDRGEFVRRMSALSRKLKKDDPDFGRAYDNMYKLAQGL